MKMFKACCEDKDSGKKDKDKKKDKKAKVQANSTFEAQPMTFA